MDAYFASLEQARDPSLRCQPVVVGGVPGTRTTVASASYEARAYGVNAGMPVAEAARLCPLAAFRPVDVVLVRRSTRRIFEILGEFSPRVEPTGFDEAFLEIDGEALEIARRIQVRIEDELGLTCSLGVSEVKSLAQMASSFAKPRGVTTLWRAEIETKLWPRPVETLRGIGPRTAARLRARGCTTVGDLARAGPAQIEAAFGRRSAAWMRDLRGEDSERVTPIAELRDARSIGHVHTPPHDLVRRADIEERLDALATRIGRRAQRAGMAGRRVVLTLGVVEIWGVRSHTRSHKLQDATSSEETLCGIARALLRRTHEGKPAVRRIGLTLHDLERADARQLSLGV